MSDIQSVRGLLVVADWAETVNGKLYIQGAGWSRIKAGMPSSIAIAGLITVPFGKTNIRHTASVRLVTDDGAPYPAEMPFVVELEFECGRPPGMSHGEDSYVPVSAQLAGIQFPRGRYRFEMQAAEPNSDPVHLADVTFSALDY